MTKEPNWDQVRSPEVAVEQPPLLTDEQKRAVLGARDEINAIRRSRSYTAIGMGVTADGRFIALSDQRKPGFVSNRPTSQGYLHEASIEDLVDETNNPTGNSPLSEQFTVLTGPEIQFTVRESDPHDTEEALILRLKMVNGKEIFPIGEDGQPYSPEAKTADGIAKLREIIERADEASLKKDLGGLMRIGFNADLGRRRR